MYNLNMSKQEYEALKKIGKQIMVHAYKFNGWLYRTWEYPVIIANELDYVVLANYNSKILTSEFNSNRVFYSETKYPSFWIFFKDQWFNLLVSIVNDKLQYYINVSSKFIYEELAIKYIDFDLDFKILYNNHWFELDRNEYNEAIKNFNYPKPLVAKIDEIDEQIKNLIQSEYFIKEFNFERINKYCNIYNDLIKEKKYE